RSPFTSHRSAGHQPLHSFPTRRSSDLIEDDQARHPELFGRLPYFLGLDHDARDGVDDDEGRVGDMERRARLAEEVADPRRIDEIDRKSTRLNSSHQIISYAVFCLKKKK